LNKDYLYKFSENVLKDLILFYEREGYSLFSGYYTSECLKGYIYFNDDQIVELNKIGETYAKRVSIDYFFRAFFFLV
jgi:hypothetical protein